MPIESSGHNSQTDRDQEPISRRPIEASAAVHTLSAQTLGDMLNHTRCPCARQSLINDGRQDHSHLMTPVVTSVATQSTDSHSIVTHYERLAAEAWGRKALALRDSVFPLGPERADK